MSIKLVLIDHEPKQGERIKVGGVEGTYVDGSTIPVSNIPLKSDTNIKWSTNLSSRTAENIKQNPLGQKFYLAKEIQKDGTTTISYFNFDGKSGTNTEPDWKPITSDGLTTETFTKYPKAKNYSEPVQSLGNKVSNTSDKGQHEEEELTEEDAQMIEKIKDGVNETPQQKNTRFNEMGEKFDPYQSSDKLILYYHDEQTNKLIQYKNSPDFIKFFREGDIIFIPYDKFGKITGFSGQYTDIKISYLPIKGTETPDDINSYYGTDNYSTEISVIVDGKVIDKVIDIIEINDMISQMNKKPGFQPKMTTSDTELGKLQNINRLLQLKDAADAQNSSQTTNHSPSTNNVTHVEPKSAATQLPHGSLVVIPGQDLANGGFVGGARIYKYKRSAKKQTKTTINKTFKQLKQVKKTRKIK